MKQSFENIKSLIVDQFGAEVILSEDADAKQPWLEIRQSKLPEVALFLRENDKLYLDFLACLSGVDFPDEDKVGVIYHLNSIPYNHQLVLKCFADRKPEAIENPAGLPEIPSVSSIWRTAIWHEREAFDLVGIWFTDHPDMRRILLPEDWKGHPLRKDYKVSPLYHDIKVNY